MAPTNHNLNIISGLGAMLVAGIIGKWDKVTHKDLLALAVALIGVLGYWGFSSTITRLERVENNQIAMIQTVAEQARIKEQRDSVQDVCIKTVETQQNHILKSIDELKSLHNGKPKMMPSLGGGDFGTNK